jgi:hypothetical protein
MSLEAFGEALQTRRPFASDRVSEPRLDVPDVTDIHQRDFELILQRAEEVVREGIGKGVTILGAPGVGKSHLLGRLFRWSRQSQGATAVFLHNLLVAPDRLPRYVLSTTIGVLTDRRRGGYGDCDLHELWEAAVRKILNLAPEAIISGEQATQAIQRWQDAGTKLDQTIRAVLLKVGINMHRAHLEQPNANEAIIEAGLAWLSGEDLEPEQIEALGFSSATEIHNGLRDDQDVERVFHAMAEMSGLAGRPFILCVDQFDNLSEAQVRATSRFLHVLVDHVPNLLCILSGVTENVLDLVDRNIIPSANWDRVAEERLDLNLVTQDQALQIVEERVAAFRKGFMNLDAVRHAVDRDSLFPLTHQAFQFRMGSALRVRPRQIIRWARESWDAEVAKCRESGVVQWLTNWSPGTESDFDLTPAPPPPGLWDDLVDEVVEQKRVSQVQTRLQNPGSLPPEDSNLMELVHRLLESAGRHPEFGVKSVQMESAMSGHPLTVETVAGLRVGVAAVVANKAIVSTLAVKRLHQDPTPPALLVLVEDDRRPIKRTATAEGYLEGLEKRGSGFAHETIGLQQHAELDALASVFLDARLGNIEVDWQGEAKTISEADVLASMVRKNLLAQAPIVKLVLDFSESSTRGGGGGGGGRPIQIALASLRPCPQNWESFLLGLAAVRPNVSIQAAAAAWCLEHGLPQRLKTAEEQLKRAALRLSLAGRATCRWIGGLLHVSKPGPALNYLALAVTTAYLG